MIGYAPWQQVVLFLGLFVVWVGGLAVFSNRAIEWAFYPWTLLCAACLPLFWFGFPFLFKDGPPAILETVIGLLIAVDMLLPLLAGYIMFRVGGKWKPPGVILASASLVFMAGWTTYVVYAAVARVTIGLL